MKEIDNYIVICDYAYVDGGATNVAIQTALMMTGVVKNVYYFTAVGPVCKELLNSKVNVVCLNQQDINQEPNRIKAAFFGIWNNKALNALNKLLDNVEIDRTVVHIHSWTKALSASVISAAFKKKVRTLMTLHDYFTVCPNGGLYNYKKQEPCTIMPMSLKCIMCNCDKRNYAQKIWRVLRQTIIKCLLSTYSDIEYIFISKFSRDLLKNRLKGIFHFVINPYDLGDRIKYDASSSKDYIYLGRVSEEKGVDIFCKAFTELIESKEINGSAIVIGDGELKTTLEIEYTKIVFVGWKAHDELSEYMKNTRALIFPSRWYETAGLTPIEFMSHGIPCIVSDGCAAKEYINNGANGLLFKNNDVESLKQAVRCLENYDIAKRISNIVTMDDYFKYSKEAYLLNVINILKGEKNDRCSLSKLSYK